MNSAAYLLIALSTAGAESTGSTQLQVVYGTDDRTTLTSEFAQSQYVAAIVPWAHLDLDRDADTYRVDAVTVGEQLNLCSGEPFAEEPAAALCTATLVGTDVLLTAGHCALPRICDDYAIVFDYALNDNGELDNIPASSVFSCTDIVRRQLPSEYHDTIADYGWLRLEEPLDRDPAEIATCYVDLTDGDTVATLGFPHDTPMKLHENGTVYDDGAPKYETFISSLDASHGNSGAPVFDDAGRLVGVLGQGGYDTYTGADGCELTNYLPDSAEYAEEQSTYACFALDGFCDRVEDEHELCGASCDGFCDDDPPPTAHIANDPVVASCSVSPGRSTPVGWFRFLAFAASIFAVGRRLRGRRA